MYDDVRTPCDCWWFKVPYNVGTQNNRIPSVYLNIVVFGAPHLFLPSNHHYNLLYLLKSNSVFPRSLKRHKTGRRQEDCSISWASRTPSRRLPSGERLARRDTRLKGERSLRTLSVGRRQCAPRTDTLSEDGTRGSPHLRRT